MTDEHDKNPSGERSLYIPDTVPVRGILLAVLGLLTAVLLTSWLSWYLSRGVRDLSVRRDPPQSPLSEMRERQLPPEPRLLERPAALLEDLHRRENDVLGSYGDAGADSATVRVPIERAMEMLVEHGWAAVPSRQESTDEEAVP